LKTTQKGKRHFPESQVVRDANVIMAEILIKLDNKKADDWKRLGTKIPNTPITLTFFLFKSMICL
jgi:hypothetical protein